MTNNKIRIFTGYLIYGSADCNRLFAYSKGLSALGYCVEIVAFGAFDVKDFKGENGIILRPLFSTRIKQRYLHFLFSRICLYFFLLFKTNATDFLLLYGSPDYLLEFIFANRKNIWHEMTETPEIIPLFTISLEKYYKLCKRIRGLFVISEPLRKLYISKGIASDNVKIINMIVDGSRFPPKDVSMEKEKYIAYCGTVTIGKDGVDDLIRAFVDFYKMHNNYKLKIIGPFWKDCSREIFDDIIPKYVKDSIIFTGRVSPMEMPKLLSSASILVLARPDNLQSKYGFPTKLGEYLLTGNPVIITRTGDIAHFLSDKYNAMIVSPNKPTEISDAMSWLTDNYQEGLVIGKRGKECALKNFNYITESKKIIETMEAFSQKQ